MSIVCPSMSISIGCCESESGLSRMSLAKTWSAMYCLKATTASRMLSMGSIVTKILSVMSKSLLLRVFWMRLTSSRAMPSWRSCSVMVMSSATVMLPSFATSQPGMSSEMISTSSRLTCASIPSTCVLKMPSRSNAMICGCDIDVRTCASPFIILPYLGPSFLKSGLTRFTRIPSSLLTYLISLTLTSLRMRFATA